MKTYLRYILIITCILGFKNASAGTKSLSNDATLKSIVLSTATTLVYSTGPADYNYTTSVSPGTATLTVEPTTNFASATVTVNGTTVASGSSSGQITLNGIVTTTINMVVTAQDGVTTHTYAIVVYETGSNDAFLSALSISTGNTLVSASSGPGTFNYTTSVSAGTSSCTVTPSTADPTATVKVNGVAVTSGSPSGAIPLNPALNATTTITVTVLAQDGVTTQTYSILVTESGSNNTSLSLLKVKTNANGFPALTSTSGTSNFNYTTAVKSNTASVSIRATSADGTATINTNGTNVPSGSYSGAINVPTGGVGILITVTAQDGVTQQTYFIQVSTNATSGAALGAVSTSANSVIPTPVTGAWSTDVDPTLNSLTLTPVLNAASVGSTITVNGVTTANGTASASIPLTSNPTSVPIVVTSQDGLTVTSYSLTVNRNGSNNANLYNMSISTNTSLVLTSQTNSVVNYQTSVPKTVTSLIVTPTPVDSLHATMTISINGSTPVAITYSTPSSALPLNPTPANSTIALVITAQDGTTKTINLTVLTTGSNNANLSNITLTPSPTSTYAFTLTSQNPTTVNYSTSFNSTTTSLTLTPTSSDPAATMTITANGTTVPISNNGTSNPITLNAVGSTTLVTLTITSPDGTVVKTTNITISRNGSNNANSAFTLSTNTQAVTTTGPYNSNYTSAVSPHTISLTVNVTTVDPNATITVNGLAAVSGSPSYPITLNNGSTPIVIQVTAPDGVTTKSTGITITRTGAMYTWTGASSTSWTNTGNWNPAKVPGASDVASIGETAYSGAQPSIGGSSGTTTFIGEVYFGSATPTTLTIPLNVKLSVGTNLTVDPGATATITGTNTSTVDILSGATLNVSGTLTINSNIKFTLKSNSSGSASVGPTTAGAIVGNVTVERYIQGGSSVYRGYRLLSSPVYQSAAGGNNIYSVNYIQNSSLVTGTNPSGGFNKVGNPSLYLFREDVASNNNSFTGGNYWGISDLTHAPTYYLNGVTTTSYNIPVANGFFFFFRGDNINNVSNGNKYVAGTVAESVTLSTTGTLNTGPITVHDWFTVSPSNPSTLSYTTGISNSGIRGFNLVGNPYASSIDWDTFSSSNSGAGVYGPSVSGAVYIIDPVSKNYGVYIANSPYGGTNNATHVIPSGQGFFVQASAAGAALTFNESSKTTAQVLNADLLLGTPIATQVDQHLHLKLLNKDSVQMDEIFISFKDNAQSGYVFGEDAPQKPGFGIASLASMSSDGVALSINNLKLLPQSQSIALNVGATASGNYVLAMPEIKSVPALYSIWLMDAYKKDSVDMRQSPNYSFTINTTDAASYGANRFSIVIRQNTNLTLRLLNFSAAKATGGAKIIWKTVNEQNYTNFTVERSTNNGNTFEDLGGFVSSAEGTYSFLDKNPLITNNLYRLKLADVNGAISYSQIVTLQYSTLSDNLTTTAVNVYPNPTHGMINLAINQSGGSSFASGYSALQTLGSTPGLSNDQTVSTQSYDIRVFSITGNLVKSAKSTQPTWQSNLSDLQPGTYVIQVLNSSDKSVVGKSTFVKL